MVETLNHQIGNQCKMLITKKKHKMCNKTNFLKTSILKVIIIAIIVHCGSLLYAQNYAWEIDKEKRREIERKRELDSLMVHLKNNWQFSLSYGQFYFNNSAKSKDKSLLAFPKQMGVWNLSCARYLSEHLSVNANFGILIKKIKPPRPNVFSILGGADVEIEGGGILLVPVSVGMDYFFLKQRFRPYAGFSVGVVPAKYKYIEGSGNISVGIHKNEYKFNSNAPFIELSSGFIYRTGKNVQLGLNCDHLQSKDFNENIGGYKAYNGFKVSVVFSVVF